MSEDPPGEGGRLAGYDRAMRSDGTPNAHGAELGVDLWASSAGPSAVSDGPATSILVHGLPQAPIEGYR